MNDLARPAKPARRLPARFIAALVVLVAFAGPAAPARGEMVDSAWTRPVVRTSLVSLPPAPVATAPVIAMPAALTFTRIDAAHDGVSAPAQPHATLSAVDVKRLLYTRLTLDPRLGSEPTGRRRVGLAAAPRGRGPWHGASGDDGPVLPLLRVPAGPGSLTVGLGRKWLDGRSRRIAPRRFGPVPDMASFLMAQGARVGDDGFVIPTLQWRPGGNLRMELDVPVATKSRADNWGVVGRLSIGF